MMERTFGRRGSRESRAFQMPLLRPEVTRDTLLHSMKGLESGGLPSSRQDRSIHFFVERRNSSDEGEGSDCKGGGGGVVPSRLCRTKYNTTAPLYGVSLTSGQTVTIVQKFPDLLQQVIYEVCESKECDVIRGECVQTYIPYLFLVIPLGPVTLTGQDYVLVESGCVCRPKFSSSPVQGADGFLQQEPQLPQKDSNTIDRRR
ncbi:unnamed protein product [Darwinula stevensoni]|uniref:Uncharacterized protein n=1 Tax=Darwinula stevensoni TaxID=69355 RepID=A0A7R8XEV3_9CRUS|nr:unnamed protein product [Darwinula stevensoni]CAG0895662.1 unnamed protein product [Darwinula stevensoni]